MTVEFFDTIEVGSEIPPLVKNISRRQLFMYSATTWDSHPGHYDRAFAQAQGFRDVYLDGPMDAAFLAQLITDWVGLNGTLSNLSVTYKAMVFPGDTLTGTGRVVSKDTKDGPRLVRGEVQLQNQTGEIVAAGKAEVIIF